MAIVTKQDAIENSFHKDCIKEECWFCGNDLWSHSDDYVVMWAGFGHGESDGLIYMHPDCAMHLSTRLIRDVVQGGSHLERKQRAA